MNKILLKNTIKLTIGGVALGLLHQYDLVIALLLVLKIIHSFYKSIKNQTFSILMVIGFIITALIGCTCEYYGTKLGYWEYHDVAHKMPRWLFFAWGAAFILIYQIEIQINQQVKNLSEQRKKYMILFMAAFFPTLGEMIAINLGTWTYYMPYKIFGVPLAAIFALVIIHTSVNAILKLISKKFKIKDFVFNPSL